MIINTLKKKKKKQIKKKIARTRKEIDIGVN